jgi:hypothetical protein
MKIKPILFLVALIALAFCLRGVVHDHKTQFAFARIQPGANETSVLKALGKPHSIDHSCSAYGTKLAETCDHVLIYRSSFAPLKSSYWLVFFDANGMAKATSRELHH